MEDARCGWTRPAPGPPGLGAGARRPDRADRALLAVTTRLRPLLRGDALPRPRHGGRSRRRPVARARRVPCSAPLRAQLLVHRPRHTLDVAYAQRHRHAAGLRGHLGGRGGGRRLRRPTTRIRRGSPSRRRRRWRCSTGTVLGGEYDVPRLLDLARDTFGADVGRAGPRTLGATRRHVAPGVRPAAGWCCAARSSARASAGRGRVRLPPRRAARTRGAGAPDRGRPAARGRQPHAYGAARRRLPRPAHPAGRDPLGRRDPARTRRRRLARPGEGAARAPWSRPSPGSPRWSATCST